MRQTIRNIGLIAAILGIVLGLIFWHGQRVSALTTSYKSPSASASDSWTNSANMNAQDGTSANGNFGASVNKTTFGFTASDIPAFATIDGVTVEVDSHKTGTRANTLDINLLNVGTCTLKTITMDTTDDSTYNALGGAADKWSCTSLTQANVVSTSFGVSVVAAKSGGANPVDGSYNVDHVRIKIDYTEASGKKVVVITEE